jgi:hypothetical protein
MSEKLRVSSERRGSAPAVAIPFVTFLFANR